MKNEACQGSSCWRQARRRTVTLAISAVAGAAGLSACGSTGPSIPRQIASLIPSGAIGHCDGSPNGKKLLDDIQGPATAAAACTGPNPSDSAFYFLYPTVSDARTVAAKAYDGVRCASASRAALTARTDGVWFCTADEDVVHLLWSYDRAPVLVWVSGSAPTPAAQLHLIQTWLQTWVRATV